MERDRFIVGVPLGRWQTNCFVVGDRAAGTSVVIDPGETGATVVPELLTQYGVRCEAILLTHGHIDHYWAVPELARSLDVPVFLNEGDRWLWDNPLAGLGQGLPVEMMEQSFGFAWEPPTERLQPLLDHQRLTFGGTDFVARHTPGHTPGHVTFLGEAMADAEISVWSSDPPTGDVLFSGDLIFQGSIGRTDFPRGSTDELFDSLVRTVVPLADDTLILSGHGPETTVGTERHRNPYVAQAISQRG